MRDPAVGDGQKKATNANKILIAVGSVSLILLLACGGVIFWAVKNITHKTEYAATDWRPVTLPNGQATAMFPVQPRLEKDALDPTCDRLIYEGVDEVIVFQLDSTPYDTDVQNALDDELTIRIQTCITENDVSPSSISRSNTTYMGYEAREASVDLGLCTQIMRAILVPGNRENVVYFVWVGGINLSDADRDKFLNSVTLIRPKRKI